MNRREFLNRSTTATLSVGLGNQSLIQPLLAAATSGGQQASSLNQPGPAIPVLPGTAPLTMQGDLALQMVERIRNFLLHETELQATRRERQWNRDYSSPENYERSVASNRQSLRQMIGVVDERVSTAFLEFAGGPSDPAEIARGPNYKIYTVRWRVFAPATPDSNGLEAEGLLLEPQKPAVARVVAIPDADCTPEMLVGLAPGISAQAQFARRLAENGCQGHCARHHESRRHLLRHSRHTDDEYAASRVDLPHGL